MADLALDVAEWAAENFGTCELGDARRTRRAVKLAQQMAEHPDGSTPAQTERWADLQAAYRLVDGADVTCDAVAEPHWRQTRATAAGRVLLVGDTTETDFGIQRQLEGLGPTGDGAGRGFFRHRSLRVVSGTREIIGLAGQELFDRQPKPKGETDDQARQREQRESRVWGRVTDRVGAPADGVPYVHVFDRGADNIEVFCHVARQRCDGVIRASSRPRTVVEETADGSLEPSCLRAAPDRQPRRGTYCVVKSYQREQVSHREVFSVAWKRSWIVVFV